jgi:type I restriction enzyme S subunit
MSLKWPKIELSELTEKDRSITYGVVKPGEEVDNGVAFIRGGDVSQGRIAIDVLRTISPQLSQTYKRTLLRGGELLISLVGNPGEVAIAPSSLQGANIARQVGLIALKPEVDAKYVMYFLMSPVGRAELFTRTGGAVQQVINLAELKTVAVPLPSLAVQQRISEILSSYDDLIDNNRRRMALLEDSARQLYREWFVRLRFPGHEHTPIVDSVPQGWERKTLGESITLNYGKALKAELRVEGDYPVYGSSGIVGTHEKPLVQGPAIVLGRKGNVGSVYWSSKSFYAIDTVYFVSPESSSLYLYYVLKHMHFISTDVAVPGLNRDFAYSRPMLHPPETLLRSFHETVDPIHAQLDKLDETNQKLRQARDLLLPRLMSGELAV